MRKLDEAAGDVMRLLSRTGPEVPPDVAATPLSRVLDQPTRVLPVVVRPPTVAARAVIVYETSVRRPWRLWVFAAVLVALTVGVVLGQAVAYQPAGRTAARAEAAVLPAAPSPMPELTAPLGTTTTRRLEVTGAATVLRVRSADLGDTLFRIVAIDASAAPTWVDTPRGPHLDVVRTGAAGTVGVDIQLNAKVAWTIRLTGGAAEQDLDLRAGGLAGLEVTGGNSRVRLELPKPKGTVPVSVSGTVSELAVRVVTGTPVRLRLDNGAGVTTVDGKVRARLTPAGWKSARNRYDVVASATIGSVSVDHHREGSR
ncbi:hypothetical protein ACWKSP_34225 [Micromonosporaceae bacterium Da 78-11]